MSSFTFYGLVCDIEPIAELVKQHKILLIEDCCQTPLAEYHGRKVGTFSDVACFSFDAEKHLSSGGGGAITTNNDELAERSRRFAIARGSVPEKGYGRRHVELGLNYRWHDVAAAIGLAQLKILPEQNERRRYLADALTQRIADIPGVYPPYVLPDTKPTWWLYFLRNCLPHMRGAKNSQKSGTFTGALKRPKFVPRDLTTRYSG